MSEKIIKGVLSDYVVLDFKTDTLEQAINEAGRICTERGLKIALTPTTLLMVRYAYETDTEWAVRCAHAQKITKELYETQELKDRT